MAAPVIAAQLSGEVYTTTSIPITISGLSVSDGDLMIAAISTVDAGNSYTGPTGSTWTLIFDNTAGAERLNTWYRIASSEPSSYTWTSSNSVDHVYAVLKITGAPSSSPIDVYGFDYGTAADNAFPCPSASGPTTAANDLVIQLVGYGQGDPVATTVPSGYTYGLTNAAGQNLTYTTNLNIGWINQSSAGTIPAANWSANYNRSYGTGVIAVLSGGAAPPPAESSLPLMMDF